MQPTLLIGILLDLATAVMMSYVGMRVMELADGDGPLRRSSWFWYGATLFMLLDGGFALVIMLTDVPLWVATGVLIVRRLAFTGGWLALGGWLTYLNDGEENHHWGTYTAVVLSALFIQTWIQGVGGYEFRPWSVALIPGTFTAWWVSMIFGLVIFVPTAYQALRMLRLIPRLSPIQRYRCIVMSASVITFSALIVLGFIDNDWFWYGLLENRSVFTIATGVLIAVRPPWFLRIKGVPRMTSARQFPGKDHLVG